MCGRCVASGERSFSKLKLIKIHLRSTMSQDRLCNLSILSIENKIAKLIDYLDVIDDHSASIKAKKFLTKTILFLIHCLGRGWLRTLTAAGGMQTGNRSCGLFSLKPRCDNCVVIIFTFENTFTQLFLPVGLHLLFNLCRIFRL